MRKLLRLLDRTVFCAVGAHGRCSGTAFGKGGLDSEPCPCPCHRRSRSVPRPTREEVDEEAREHAEQHMRSRHG